MVLILVGLLGFAALTEDEPATVATPVDGAADFFEQRIRPVFVEHCAKCHGASKQEMGLRLDSAAAFARGSDAGPVVTPGDPENSALVEAVRHAGGTKMPPDRKLPDQTIADIESWVKHGAAWPAATADSASPAADPRAHWAFQSVTLPPVPESIDADTPIDSFIHARLARAGLVPSSSADRHTLLRRLTFDLTGLPPDAAAFEAFESDPRPDGVAYASVVERLLASPAYGERWGRHWLDVARYADTKGYVFLQEPNYPWAYTYRDYVVRSLNEDVSYDRFVIEQIAADKLDNRGDSRALAALGFITVGGRFMNNESDILDDRVDVVTRGLMGLTVTCARCHDHKFDPISQKDYYSLYGVFASSVEPTVAPLYEPEPDTDAYRTFAAELAKRETELSEFIRVKHAELVNSAMRRVDEYLISTHKHKGQPTTDEFMEIADSAELNPKLRARWRNYLNDARREHSPVFAVWFALEGLDTGTFERDAPAAIEKLASDASKPINSLILTAFRAQPPRSLVDAARRYQQVLWSNEVIAEDWARRAALEGRTPILPDAAREELRLVFHAPGTPPDVPLKPEGDLALLPDRPSQARLQQLLGAVESWRTTGPGAPPRAMVLNDAKRPVKQHVFLRGNPARPGPEVARQFPEILTEGSPEPFQDGSGRLELARAIADPKNPLTARVLVNRAWMHHFGTPLVSTPGDFGTRSDTPSHPELLDWLASTFVADGWSIKALHRRIVMSATYRQNSAHRPEAAAIDPENTLYWRANRRRLDLESTRDALLAVSGTLDRRIGGPAFAELADVATPRRTLYAKIDRLNLPGLFRTFDFADPNVTNPKRDQTTVPPQALFLLNHPMVEELARRLVSRTEIANAADNAGRVTRIYEACLGRAPSTSELTLAVEYLGESKDAKAVARLAQALFLSNEFVFVD